MFAWESDGKYLFPELDFSQFVNQNVKILGRRLYSPSLKDVDVLEVAELIFLNFPYICLYIFFPRLTASRRLSTLPNLQSYRLMYGKLEKLTGRLLVKLHPSNRAW